MCIRDRDKNAFVRSVIDGNDLSCRLGIVTFGYDQVYAAELSDDSDGMYEQYLRADRPNTSGTDMEMCIRDRFMTNSVRLYRSAAEGGTDCTFGRVCPSSGGPVTVTSTLSYGKSSVKILSCEVKLSSVNFTSIS